MYIYKTKKQFMLGTLNEQTIELKLLIKFSLKRKKKYVSKTVGKINGFFTPYNISPTRFVLIYLDWKVIYTIMMNSGTEIFKMSRLRKLVKSILNKSHFREIFLFQAREIGHLILSDLLYIYYWSFCVDKWINNDVNIWWQILSL